MKKIIAILVLAAMLTACAGGDNTPAETTVITEAVTETTTVTTTEATTTSATETETNAVEECNCKYEWQHAFSEYINGQDFYMGLYVGDINGDEIPEAVIDVNTFGNTEILFYTENGVETFSLGVDSTWGYVRYVPETMQILHCPFFGHTTGTFGYEEHYIYDWTDEGYVESFSMLRKSGSYKSEEEYEYNQGYINGEEVDFDTFEAKLAEINQLVEENEYFPSVLKKDENFESYIAENLPCVKFDRETDPYANW